MDAAPRRSAEDTREIRRLIRETSLANGLWGVPRIHGELLKLGIKSRSRRSPSTWRGVREGGPRAWKTFVHNHAAGIGAMDFLIVPTIGFRLLW